MYPDSFFEDEDQVMFSFSWFIDRLIDLKRFDLQFSLEYRLPIGSKDLNDLINSFVFFYPIYDSVLRIAKGEKDIFEELVAKLKFKDLHNLEYMEEDDTDTDNGTDDEKGDRPKLHYLTEDEEDLLAKSVDGKRVVKAGMRWQAMERDDFKCTACGVSAKEGAILHVDHIIPRSKGGRDTMDNYQTLCRQCNIGKSNKSHTNLRNKDLK